MYAVKTADNGAVLSLRLATYAVYLSTYAPLGWVFVDHNQFLLESERADFMASPTSYVFDPEGSLYKTTDTIDNDVSGLSDPWA